MKFSIRAIDIGNPLQGLCESIFGDHKELVPLITTLWTLGAYESQWMDSLESLLDECVNCCVLITDVQPPQDSSGVTYWAMYKEGDFVYLQEQFSRDLATLLIGSATAVMPHIPPRIQGSPEEQSEVSEWVFPIEDIRQFVNDRNRLSIKNIP